MYYTRDMQYLYSAVASQSPECCADLVGLGVGGGFLVAWVGAGALLRVEQHEVHLGPEQEAERHRGRHRHTHHQARDLDLGMVWYGNVWYGNVWYGMVW